MKTAFIFPGQGSQKVGMGADVSESLGSANAVWSLANAVLGYDLHSLCFDGPDDDLRNTLHAQPALLTVGYLHFWRACEEGRDYDMVAGHSLGEYTALVAAGALELEDALRLVKRRAELMSQAPSGAMAALIGLADEKLDAVLTKARSQGEVVAANFNSPGQIVVSGEPAAVEAAMSAAKAEGAKIAVKLPVSGAFHSPLMAAAGEEMASLIEAAPFRDARVPVYSNTTAKAATSATELKAALIPQMTGAVNWSQSITNMIADGAIQFVELGPGNVLTGLIKRIDKKVATENA
ncbi:polyketide biosynthesis protein BaeE [Abditibacteriota bacterium]|nr:polyketide biosynthesis protein BaeE [Abditibacteriota bacterium]